jgi:predicted CoA-binding protein
MQELWDIPKNLNQLVTELKLFNIVLERTSNIPKNIDLADVFNNLKEVNEHLNDMKKILADLGGWNVVK